MGDVGVELLLEPVPHAHAGPRECDVDGRRKLCSDASGGTFGASGADVRAFTEDHIGPAFREIVRARTADDSATDHDDSHGYENGLRDNGSIVGK